jgi:hypothetical protein
MYIPGNGGFRKDHGEAIRKVCREFVLLCRRLKLFELVVQALVLRQGSTGSRPPSSLSHRRFRQGLRRQPSR